MREIVIEVSCQGCGEQIAAPSDADWELFRAGVHVHDRDACREAVETRLREQRAFAREERRARDLDDGVVWSDDH